MVVIDGDEKMIVMKPVLDFGVLKLAEILRRCDCETVQIFEYLTAQLGNGDNPGSADRRCEEVPSKEGGSLIGSEPVVDGTGHDAAG